MTHLKHKGKNTDLQLDLNRLDFMLEGRDLFWVCHLCYCTVIVCRVRGGSSWQFAEIVKKDTQPVDLN